MRIKKIKDWLRIYLTSKRSLGATDDSWKNPEIPEEQLKIAEQELKMLHAGNAPSVYTVAADALGSIPGSDKLTLLDIGCASGYYFEVISTLIGKRFTYTGADYSEPMLRLARKRYPNAKFMKLDIREIDLPDLAYDVVFTGAVLVHVKEWEKALREVIRVSRAYLILHRVPVADGKPYRIEKRIYAGIPAFFNTFNRDELISFILEFGFRKIIEKNVYPNEREGRGSMTYVFERR